MIPKQLAFSNPVNEAGGGMNLILHRFITRTAMDANAVVPETSASENLRLGLR